MNGFHCLIVYLFINFEDNQRTDGKLTCPRAFFLMSSITLDTVSLTLLEEATVQSEFHTFIHYSHVHPLFTKYFKDLGHVFALWLTAVCNNVH